MRFVRLFYFIVFCFFGSANLFAVDFDDVKEDQGKVYGSEKDKRYDAFFVEWENYPRKNPTHSSFHFLWLYNTTTYPKYTKTQLFPFYNIETSRVDPRYEANHLLLSNYAKEANGSYSYRLLPFYYSGVDSESIHRNFLGFIDYEKDTKKDSFSRIWISPIVYWKRDSYLNVFPFYFLDISTEDKSKNVFGIIPPFFYNDSPTKSTFYLLNFYSNSQMNKDSKETFTTFAPFYFQSSNNKGYSQKIIPILYYSETEENGVTHKNILLSYDHSTDKNGNLDRLFISPFYFYKKDSYFHIAPFYFSTNSRDDKYGGWFGIFPPSYYSFSPNHKTLYFVNFYSNTTQTKETTEKFITFAPFYFQSSNNKGYSQQYIPLVYYSHTKEDGTNYKNILNLYSQSNDKNGNLDKLFFFPIVYYQKDYFFHIAPIYWSWIDNRYDSQTKITEKNYRKFVFPIGYREKNADTSSYTNVIGLFSREYDEKGKLKGSMIAPFYFYKKDSYDIIFPFTFKFGPDAESEDTGTRWGLFYYNDWNKKEKTLWIANWFSYHDKTDDTYFKSLTPVYYSWKTKESTGELSPTYFTIQFTNQDRFHLNLAGYSSNVASGVLKPDFDLNLGEKEGYKYLDTDVSWLWYVFRMSSRTSTKIFYDLETNARDLIQNKDTVADKKEVNTVSSAKISKQKNFTREDSVNFFGVNLLFGLYGWEAGDSKRHIRAFPLTWFTYDKKSNDTVIAAPFFVHYDSQDIEYTVFFPFYGKQRTPESKRIAYGLIGYISESIQENRAEERSILWPIANWHKSDVKSGSRILPFFWYRNRNEGTDKISTLISPLFFYNNTLDRKGTENAYVISPLWLRFYSRENDESSDFHFTVPFYFFKQENTKYEKNNLFVSLPFIYYGVANTNRNSVYNRTLAMVPIVAFYNKDNFVTNWNIAIIVNSIETKNNSNFLVFPIYYHDIDYEKNKIVSNTRFIFPVYYKQEYDKETGFSKSIDLYSPFFVSSSKYDVSNKLNDRKFFSPLPFVYYTYTVVKEETYWNVMLFTSYRDSNSLNNLQILPFYTHDKFYEKGKLVSVTRYLFPAYYHKNFAKTPEDTETVSLYSPLLIYESSENVSKKTDEKSWFAPFPLLYHSYNSANNESYWNWLVLSSYEKSRTAHNIKIYPIFYQDFYEQDPSNYNYTNWFVPFYFWNDTKKTTIVTQEDGTTKKDSESEFSFYSILGLYLNYNHTNKKLFFPIPFIYHSYLKANEETYWNWLLFASYEDSKTENSSKVLPLYYNSIEYKNGKVTSISRWIFPFYYKKDTAKSKDETEAVSLYSPFIFYNTSEIKSKNFEDTSWFFPIPVLYHSYKSENNESYWNWLGLSSYEKSKTAHNIKIFPIFYQDFFEQDSKNYNYTNWFAPIYFWNKSKKTQLHAEDNGDKTREVSNSEFSFYSILGFYTNRNDTHKKWVLPLLLAYHSENPGETYSNWLGIVSRERTNTKTSFSFFPITYYDEEKKQGLQKSSLWVLPLFFYKKEEDVNSQKFDKTFLSLLYNDFELESKTEKNKIYERSILFPIIPFIYYKNSNIEEEHRNILMFYDSAYKKGKLVRLVLFPFWYSLNTENIDSPKTYTHFFPLYFSSEANNEYSAFILGMYWSSNSKRNSQNFLMLAEHEYSKETNKREVTFLFRAIQFANAKEEVNVKLLYGLGNYSSNIKETSMNLFWFSSKEKKQYSYNNILPFYYSEKSISEKLVWFAPTLYYSNKTESESMEHAGLGALYYKSSDKIKKEDHLNVLMGILYYKTSVPKERGYEGSGSLWGLLWEYKTESETKYSKFSVLKFVYTKTTDETGETYQRIMGVKL